MMFRHGNVVNDQVQLPRGITKKFVRKLPRRITKKFARKLPRRITKKYVRKLPRRITRKFVRKLPGRITKKFVRKLLRRITKKFVRKLQYENQAENMNPKCTIKHSNLQYSFFIFYIYMIYYVHTSQINKTNWRLVRAKSLFFRKQLVGIMK